MIDAYDVLIQSSQLCQISKFLPFFVRRTCIELAEHHCIEITMRRVSAAASVCFRPEVFLKLRLRRPIKDMIDSGYKSTLKYCSNTPK